MPTLPRFAIADTALRRHTPQASLTPGQAPPRDYYTDNLLQLLQFVQWRYKSVLDRPLLQVLDAIAGLPTPAARLLARLATRKGALFRLKSLQYAEVSDLPAAIAALQRANLVECQGPVAADLLLQKVTIAELRDWFGLSTQRNKAATVAHLLSDNSDHALRCRLGARCQWLQLTCAGDLQRAQQLYFGGRSQDLSAFVMEDLGLMRYPAYQLSAPDWLTADPACLLAHESLQSWAAMTHLLDTHARPEALALALSERLLSIVPSREQARIRDRALLRLGQFFERQALLPEALLAYGGAGLHPARERQVRILTNQGQDAAADSLRQIMREHPWCASESDFAENFGKRRAPQHTQTQLSLVGETPAAIEECAAQLLLADGGQAWHLENQLPLGLAGLQYWDALYADIPGTFTRPFQLGPNDLYWPDFAQQRSNSLRTIEARWQCNGTFDAHAWAAHIQRSFEAHQDTANPLVRWQAFDEELLKVITNQVPAMARLAAFTIRQLNQYRTGFPDLLLSYPNGAIELVEVKGPNDQLQGGQRRWLAQLAQLQIPARVLKLRAARG